ncbi:MAG: hypothetical protein CSA66_06465 [Proteobacteria bacterium]|nr:MAG: hypothetical protein CSA66_06465 [Pseudomonadota bacterium]
MSVSDRRIGSIMQFISAVSAGDFEARLETTGANDELDTLMAGLNGLASELAAKSGTLSTFERYTASLARANAELERREQHLAALAYHDALTGLPNRKGFEEHADDALDDARATGWNVALLLVDLDGFKPVNDRHGHKAGDEVLRVVAQRLADAVGDGGVVCRLGGDEFAVIMRRARGLEHATALARTLNVAVSKPIPLPDGGTGARVSASIGVTLSRGGRLDRDHLLETADQAMYDAKRRGPGHFCVREPRRALRLMRVAPSTSTAAIRFPRSASHGQLATRRTGFVSPEAQRQAGRVSA